MKHLCDHCINNFAECAPTQIIFAGDLFSIPDITIKELDCVVNCDIFKEKVDVL